MTSTRQPIVLEMKTWRQRNCWARLPRPAAGWRAWHGGTSGHCATWYCQTPWGAVWGAWKLHNLTRPVRYDGRRLARAAVTLLLIQVGFLAALAVSSDGDAEALVIWALVAAVGALSCLFIALSRRAR